MRRVIAGFAIGAAIMVAGPEGPAYVHGAQEPRFRAGVDVTLLDVTVLDGDGQPVTDLKPSEFSVKIDGQDRRVVSAEWIPLASSAVPGGNSRPAVLSGYVSNQAAVGGRMIVFYLGAGVTPQSLRPEINAFIDALEPSDRVAVVGLRVAPFTTDHESLKRALWNMAGDGFVAGSSDPVIWDKAGGLVQSGGPVDLTPTQPDCREWDTLLHLLENLKAVTGPKTMLLLSGGIPRTDDILPMCAFNVRQEALATHTTVYSLYVDRRTPNMSSRDLPDVEASSIARLEGRDGLSYLANATGGTLYTVAVTADQQLKGIAAAISGYYLVGVESETGDRDDADRDVSASVRRDHVIVRARHWLHDDDVARATTADDQLKAAFGTFSDSAEVPLRVATFTLRQPNSPQAFVLLHAEIGADHRAPAPIAMGYTISKPDGTLVTTKSGTSTLAPMTPNTPSPLELTSTFTIDPGDYLLKLAVVDGDRVGSVERPMHVGFAEAGAFTTSDLIAGGVPTATPAARPPVASIVREDFVQGFFEVYGDGGAALRARYDVLPREGTKSAATAEIGPASAAGKTVFAGTVDVHALPPGAYVLRATLIGRDGPLQTLTTGFERVVQ
jgi:VWFA-related protein